MGITISETLRMPVLGLQAWQWLGLPLTILIGIAVGLLVRFILSRVMRLRARLRARSVTLRTVKSAGQAVVLLVAALVFAALLPELSLPDRMWLWASRIAVVIQVFGATWLFAAIWEGVTELLNHRAGALSRQTGALLLPVGRKVGRALIVLFGGIAMLTVFGLNVGAIVAGLGIGGIAVALAAKDSVENVFGSLTVVLDMPFGVGDWIKLDKVEGIVEEINLRSTRIRTFQDSLITLPNSNLIRAAVENMGRRRFRRYQTRLNIAARAELADIESFAAALREEFGKQTSILADKSSVHLNDVNDFGYTLLLNVFFDVPDVDTELVERERFLSRMIGLMREHRLDLMHAPPPPPAAG